MTYRLGFRPRGGNALNADAVLKRHVFAPSKCWRCNWAAACPDRRT